MKTGVTAMATGSVTQKALKDALKQIFPNLEGVAENELLPTLLARVRMDR